MTVYPLQANMTRGELTPLVHARADSEHYAAGVAEARNVVVTRYGGVTRVPGTIYDGSAKFGDRRARWLRFEFNRQQVYAIEAGHLYFRFWTTGGRIESPPGTPVEVVTPYTEDDLRYLRVRQLGDVIYIWCRKAAGGAHQPRRLTRNSETSWTLEAHVMTGGPFIKEATEGTVLTPSGRGSYTPIMTDSTSPSGTASGQNDSGNAYRAFDGTETSRYVPTGRSGWVAYASGVPQVVDAYWFTASNSNPQDTPRSWTVEGYDGSDWIVLDSRNSEAFTGGETRFFDFPNERTFDAYRLAWTAVSAESSSDSTIGEIGFHVNGDFQVPTNLVASSTAGINGGAGFLASDVGRPIRIMGSDGRWRTAIIAARTNATTVTVRIYDHALPDHRPIARWQLGVFSDASGWPATGAVYEDRLFHASTADDPLGLWGSVNSDYDNHAVSQPLVADDAVSVRLTGGKLDDISWLLEQRDSIVVGTAGSLRAVGRNNDSEALGPSNFRQRAQTLAPASFAEPVTIENVLLFMDLFEQRLYEAMYTYEVDGYLAREASTLNEHLFAAGVAEIVYLQHPHSVVVGRRYDGKLIFFTYDRANKVAGGTLVDYNGEVESILDLPGETGTDLWMLIKRNVGGSDVRRVERMAEFWRSEFTTQDVPIYGTSSAVYDGAATNSVTGLNHIRGKTCGIWADGRDLGKVVVPTSGEVVLPGGIEAEQIVIGEVLPWRVKTLRLSQIGNQDGSGLGRAVTIVSGYVDLYEAAGIMIGTPGQMDELRFEDLAEEDPDAPTPLRTGMFNGPVDDNWRNDGVLVIEGDTMYPATVRAIQLNVDGEP
jgi:hypothetical protein